MTTTMPRPPEGLKPRSPALVRGLLTLALAGLLVTGALLYLSLRSDDQAARTDAVPTVATADGAFVFGPAGAATVVEVYFDYQCPHCQQFEVAAGQVLREAAASGAAQVRYHPIAILDRASTTGYSSRAASASACVAEHAGTRWLEYNEQLFTHQPPEGGDGLADKALAALATAVGADDPAIAGCVADHSYLDWVGSTTSAATGRGVAATPTVLVNGARLADPTPDALRAALAAAQP